MLSRRSFLKSAALATVTLSAGYGIGSAFSNNGSMESFSFYGFLPSDGKMIEKVFGTYAGFLKNSINSVSVNGAGVYSETIKNAIGNPLSGSLFTSRHLTINLTKVNGSFCSDLLISNNNYILTPETSFNSMIKELRNKLKDTKADLMFSAEVHESTLFSNAFSNKGFLLVENEKGIFDKINLNRKQSDIIVPGNCGNTIITVGDNTAFIKTASCKNRLCQHSGLINTTNSSIACAPNKILLRLV